MGPPTASDPGAVRRIALVHHSALTREGLCRILSDDGFQVVWQGADGAQIVEHLGESSPDLILLDWEAPGVGAPLIEKLAAPPGKTPIVLLSRPEIHDDLGPALEAGATGCLSANLEATAFLMALKILTAGDRVISHDMIPSVSGTGDSERQETQLTPRELEILRALGRGATNQEIAEELFLSPHTVKVHVHQILVKMGFRNRAQAAAYAATKGMV